jgi:hypothetical protein
VSVPILIFAYFSPETLLPVTSIVATVIGVVMMFGKTMFRLTLSALRSILRRPAQARAQVLNGPHQRHRIKSRVEAARR